MKDSYIFYENKLNDEYKPVFEQVEMFVLTQNIDESTREERLGDLLDIFLSAQDAGKPIQKIVGNDIEQFCKTFCSDFGIKNRILNIADWMKSIAWIFVVISVLDVLWLLLDGIDTGSSDIKSSISSLDISMYFIAIAITSAVSIVTNIVIRHFMFKTKRVSMRLLKIVGIIEAVLSFGFIILMLSINETNLIDCPTWLVFSCACVYLLIYYLLCGKRIKRQKVKFTDLVQNEVIKELDDTMMKRFEKGKKKNLKKGKGELSFEEFLDKEEKSCNLVEKMKLFYAILPLVATGVAYMITYLSEGFETYTDSVVFIGIMLAVEYPILLGMWKIEANGLKMRRAWIKAKRGEKVMAAEH